MKYQLFAACGCNIGRRRSNNEDNFYFNGLILPEENSGLEEILLHTGNLDEGRFFSVFDGMGGQADGQIASFLAANTFKEEVEKENKSNNENLLLKISEKMTENVWKCADANFSNMGTTSASMYFEEEDYIVANVGDSRVFLFRGDCLKQISVDHTDEIFIKENGLKKQKPSLTQYIGINPDELMLEPHIEKGKLCPLDQFLICSDGLTDMVDTTQISNILVSQESVEEKVRTLIKTALANGGRDNITIILIQILENTKRNEKTSDTIKVAETVVQELEAVVAEETIEESKIELKESIPEKLSEEKIKTRKKHNTIKWACILLCLGFLVGVVVGEMQKKKSMPTNINTLDISSTYSFVKEFSEDGNYFYIDYLEYSGNIVRFKYEKETDELYTINVINAEEEIIGNIDFTEKK